MPNRAFHDCNFLKRAIFVISSPQEAMGLLALMRGECLEICIVVQYIGYANGTYSRLINRILSEGNIKKILTINLYLHNVEINKAKIYSTFKNIYKNKILLSEFNNKYFMGNLFKSEFNFVSQIYSPLLSLNRYNTEKIYILEHSPTDSRERIGASKKNRIENIGDVRKKKYNFSINLKTIGLYFFKIKRKILADVVNFLFPNMRNMRYIKKGFSWVNYGDEFSLVDYRGVKFNFSFNFPSEDFKNKPKTILLIESNEAFRDVPEIYEEMKGVDFIEMYSDMLCKHIALDELIICKLHPYTYQNSNELEIDEYIKKIKAAFNRLGYKKIHFLNEILSEKLLQLMPVEALIEPLKVNKILGIYSSAMLVLQHWEGVTVISDCRWIKEFSRIREGDKRFFDMKFVQI